MKKIMQYRLTTWRDWMGLALIIAGIVDVWHALNGRGNWYFAIAIVTWAIGINTWLEESWRKHNEEVERAARALLGEAD